MHFQTFRLQPPHAPPSSGHTSCSGRAWPPLGVVTLSAVLRISLFTSRLISRIRPNRVCVAALAWAAVLRTILSFPVALHALLPGRSYFHLVAGSTATEGLPPSNARSFSSALAVGAPPPASFKSYMILAFRRSACVRRGFEFLLDHVPGVFLLTRISQASTVIDFSALPATLRENPHSDCIKVS